MGLVIDTGVLIRVERSREVMDFNQWLEYGEAYLSAITCLELLVGIHQANTAKRRVTRTAFVERLLADLPVLNFDLDTARVHAELLAAIPKNITVGAHDLIIGATAMRYGFALLTTNAQEFRRMPGLAVLDFPGS
ncbi:MAG: PIN domain-containing protein [Burkholderiales bacterium]